MNYIYSNSHLECYKNITVLSSTKMLFWKHWIWTFDCYFERYTFNSINSGKLIQKLSSDFLKTLKQKVTLDSWCIYQSLSMVIKMKRLYFRFNFCRKRTSKIQLPWKTKSLEKAVLSHLSTSYIEIFFHHPTMVVLLDIVYIIRHSLLIFSPSFLINLVGMSVFW